MLKKTLSVVALAGALILTPLAAGAVEGPYTPSPRSEPTLAGSVVASECLGDVPWIGYTVSMDDPDDLATGTTATLVISGGGESVTLPLGQLVDGQLSGRVLWPGASVDSAGEPTGWPGWIQQDGQWVQTSGNFAWTRGPITAVIRVNPELAVPLAYPEATPDCATGPTTASTSVSTSGSTPTTASATDDPAGLAATGMDAMALPITLAVAGVLVAGGLVLVVRRRASRR